MVLVKGLRVESVDLTESFYFLWAFGLVHGATEWIDMGRVLAEVSGVRGRRRSTLGSWCCWWRAMRC